MSVVDLIDRAATVLCDGSNQGIRWADHGEPMRDIYRRRVRLLADAGFIADPTPPATTGFFIDVDGYDEPCLWYRLGPADQDVRLVLRKHHLDREHSALWEVVTAALRVAPTNDTGRPA